MTPSFPHSLRAHAVDSPRRSRLVAIVGALVVSVWFAWLMLAKIPMYAATESARLEAKSSVHVVKAGVRGRAIKVNVTLDRFVEAGDVLLTVDSEPLQDELRIAEEEVLSLDQQIEAVKASLAAIHGVIEADRTASRAVRMQTKAARAGMRSKARSTARTMRRVQELFDEHSATSAELEGAKTNRFTQAATTREFAYAHEAAVARSKFTEQQIRSELEETRRVLAELEGKRSTADGSVRSLQNRIGRHIIVSPVRGRVGRLSALHVGSEVSAEDVVAVIVPSEDLHGVAEFGTSSALGRVRRGQTVRLRASGFPWTQFGSIYGTVTNVGSESKDGQIRVEFEVDLADTNIPVAHGLPGSAEVMIEQLPPYAVLLRTIGAMTSRRSLSRI